MNKESKKVDFNYCMTIETQPKVKPTFKVISEIKLTHMIFVQLSQFAIYHAIFRNIK